MINHITTVLLKQRKQILACLWLIALIVVFILCARSWQATHKELPSVRDLALLIPLFPTGLVAIIHHIWPRFGSSSIALSLTVSWATYIVLCVAYLRASNMRLVYTFIVLLVVLLLLNIGGCQLIMSSEPGLTSR